MIKPNGSHSILTSPIPINATTEGRYTLRASCGERGEVGRVVYGVDIVTGSNIKSAEVANDLV